MHSRERVSQRRKIHGWVNAYVCVFVYMNMKEEENTKASNTCECVCVYVHKRSFRALEKYIK